VKPRPILFSGPMVRAILNGRKTQTRRVVKWPLRFRSDGTKRRIYSERDISEMNERLVTWTRHPLFQFCPFGQVGDRLWVRETWAPHADVPREAIYRCDRGGDYQDTVTDGFRWRPSIHMPRWASRITLEITGIRVERVQDITEEDAKKEGVESVKYGSVWFWKAYGHNPIPGGGELVATRDAKRSFQTLWTSINGPGSWGLNPWVWVVEFRKVEACR
jgi:hypothetical protein